MQNVIVTFPDEFEQDMGSVTDYIDNGEGNRTPLGTVADYVIAHAVQELLQGKESVTLTVTLEKEKKFHGH